LERRIAIEFIVAAILVIVGLISICFVIFGVIHAFQDIALKGNSTPAVVAGSPNLGYGLLAMPAGLVEIGTGIGLAIGAFLELRSESVRHRVSR
jgi:hypothetical protein